MPVEGDERPPEAVINDLLRLLRVSEHRVTLLSGVVLELASEMIGQELEYEEEAPRSTEALLLAHDCLAYLRS